MRIQLILVLVVLLVAPTSAQYGLPTTFAAGNGQDGNMFDVVAARDLLITGFDLHLGIEATTVRVYRVSGGGTFVGMEGSVGGWDLEELLAVTPLGEGHPTHISLDGGIFVGAGQTQGLYITVTNEVGSGMRYTVGSDFGGVAAQDASLTILEGVGKEYPFGSTFGGLTPGGPSRIWNGRVYYDVVEDVTTSFSGTNGHDGAMFDLTATEAISIQEFELNLEAGGHGVSVYAVTSAGTFVGHETTSSDWTFLGSAPPISNGAGLPTRIPLVVDFEMSAGETRGFYVTTWRTGAPFMRYTTGSNFGGVAATDGVLTIHEGVGSAFPFAGIFGSTTPGGSSRIFNGTIRYSFRPRTSPFVEDFDGVAGGGSSAAPTGWLQDLNDAAAATPNSDWLFRSDEPSSMNGPINDHTDPGVGNFAYIEDSAVGSHAAVNLLTPPIDRSSPAIASVPALGFWVNSNDAGAAQNPLSVDVIEHPLGIVHRDVRLQVGSTMGAWTFFGVCLTPYDAPVIQIAFRGRTDNGSFLNDVGLDDVSVGFTLGAPGIGQPPRPGLATLDINTAGAQASCRPVGSGAPGPYGAVAHGDGTMDITITSEPTVPVLFFAGPTNPGLLNLGAIGTLDVGNAGLTNIVLIADGNGTEFLDGLFRTGTNGDLFVALPTPAPLLGFSLGFQVITFNSSPSAISLSNAVEVTFIP